MSDHDPLCPWRKSEWIGAKGTECPHCRMIAQVVAREQENRVNPYDDYTIHQIKALRDVVANASLEVPRDQHLHGEVYAYERVLTLFGSDQTANDTGPHEPLTLENTSRLLVNTLRFLIDEFGRAGVQNTLALIGGE